ncbi:uncharacterized protein YbbC (DUF1343 family) [Wenyingzhuangia heitensis]|uniref:Uncharacterized protein YbbC (DUF1343 family) n=1 Tax=Wenyingzhuangia heitensis TaxID=1487859 RepID=A0ABX0U9Z7_9FLAO|nr:DUF1343 domain-containing protein [Wenyingzhuangia heitensis]NIJ45189.1 uncharacterized protein YbbC (DUF1343 family) [Wenyingzhuangia heitensis]
MLLSFKLVPKNTFLILVFFSFAFLSSCKGQNNTTKTGVIISANNTKSYISFLKGKKIGVVANQTSVIFHKKGHTHLVDSLLQMNIKVTKVFSPEHGFRGKADAAEHVASGMDYKTGLPIISLYGKHKKPTNSDLKNIDLVVFDIQDVGVRFYTYISTLHYVLEACAENKIPVLVLDRPNPNAHYVDGPILHPKHSSFVGKHPVPLVYGMTIGEYATMINGEKWLANGIQCDLTVISLKNYTHTTSYHLPIRPSPNLPNDTSINLYPSLGFFEGTPINAGRGTEFQFQRYGSSLFPKSDFSYTPKTNFGSKYPKDQNKVCYGVDLSTNPKQSKVSIKWLVDAYTKYPNKEKFFGKTFTIHAGDTILEHQLKKGLTTKEIENSWKKDIEAFKLIRKKYLIYP